MSSKNSGKAQNTLDTLGDSGTGGLGGDVAKCDKVKHWIRIIVKDSDGKPVQNPKPTVEVDGNTIPGAPLDKKGKYDTKKVLTDTKPAKITFPDLFNCDWWEDGAQEPKPAGEKDLPAVADGDCIVRLAATAGYRSYLDIWEAPENAAKKTDRPVPTALLLADVWKGPDKKDKSESKGVDAEWVFVVRAIKKPKLRIILVDSELKPLAKVAYQLSGIATKKGKTGADGMIEVAEIDPNATAGTLTVTPDPGNTVKKPKEKKKKLPDPPPYPLDIVADDFEEDDPVVTAFETPVVFDLKIGSLPTHKDKTGTIARLHNIAYLADITVVDEEVTKCVKNYQKILLKNNTGSGAHADIKDDIETRHTKA